MKKTFLLLVVLLASMFLLCSCECKHKELSEADCITPQKCLKCSESIGDALGHTAGKWITDKEPTCSEDGSKQQVCSVCNATIKTETLTKLGHTDGEWITDKEPTCTEDGSKHQICSVCNVTIKTETLTKLDHTEVIDEVVAPTYTTTGLTQGQHCSRCNEIFIAQLIIPTNIVSRAGNSSYGYNSFENNALGIAMKNLYHQLFDICESFITNTSDMSPINGMYILASININNYNLSINEAISVWKVFYIENPRYYWLSNNISHSGENIMICIDEDYAQASYRKACDRAIEAMVENCVASINKEESDLEIALNIHNFILDTMNYAYEADGTTPKNDIWAHNLVGCAKYNLGVCESYAKTYLYLCLLNDIDCIIVTGTANTGKGEEAHGWNLIKLDQFWYAVDITWNETNIDGERSVNFFGLSTRAINYAHVAETSNEYGINYLYNLPEINNRDIELVKLYENDTYLGLFANIDIAFDQMTNENSEYKLVLCHYYQNSLGYEQVGFFITTPQDIVHLINSDSTPKVKNLILIGYKTPEYQHSIEIYLHKELQINSNISIENISLRDFDREKGDFSFGAMLNLQNYALTCSGFCEHDVAIIGSMDENGSHIYFQAAGAFDETIFYDDVKVNSICSEGYIRITGNLDVVNLYGIVTLDGINNEYHDINIKNLYCDIKIDPQRKAYIEHIANSVGITLDILSTDHSTLIIDTIDQPIMLLLACEHFFFSVDMEGNYTESIKTIDPRQLTTPLAQLKTPLDFNKLDIYFQYQLSGNVSKTTSLYTIDENGYISLIKAPIQ